MKNSMSDAFMSMVEGTKSFKDAMREMARAVIKQLFDILVVQQLVGSFDAETGKGSGLVGGIMKLFANADGNAFSNGKVTAFADGGVVNQPTMFPMANGAGLMGEAGPEAIMPLKRGKNGKLGVQVEGGNQGNVTVQNHFHIAANGDDSVKKIIAQEAPKIANLTQKQILDQRARGGAFRTTFG
jgi:lambda family phage tail tape measure protein